MLLHRQEASQLCVGEDAWKVKMLSLCCAGQVAGWNLALNTPDASTGELLFRLDAFKGSVASVLAPRPQARQEGYYRSLVRCSKCPLHHLKNTHDVQKPKYLSQFRDDGGATDDDGNGARARGGEGEQGPITCCAVSALKRGPADWGERHAHELPRSSLFPRLSPFLSPRCEIRRQN